MVKIYKPDIFKWVRRQFNTKSGDEIESEIYDNIMPVIQVTPTIITKSAGVLNTAAVSVFTASATKKTYIVGYQANLQKDAVSTCTEFRPYVLVDGETLYLFRAYFLTTTATSYQCQHTFKHPMLIDKGTAPILNVDAVALGNTVVAITLYYYEEDD